MGFLLDEAGAGAVDMMRTIKRALDPKNILNPGKVAPRQAQHQALEQPVQQPGRQQDQAGLQRRHQHVQPVLHPVGQAGATAAEQLDQAHGRQREGMRADWTTVSRPIQRRPFARPARF
jgi:hypothetical protein